MRFALLGDHPDGLELARALGATGRHELKLYTGNPAGLQLLQRHGLAPRFVADLEELLVDPQLDAVIVAGSPSVRAAQLRRALQSECHVVCVHPADPSPDMAYEAALIQADTGRVLLPLLPMALHPGVRCLKELALEARLVELEVWSTEEALLDAVTAGHAPGVPGWDVLRFLHGEIAELIAVSAQGELAAGGPVLISGRFLSGLLFQSNFLSQQAAPRWRLAVVTTTGRAVLEFPHGWPGTARLFWSDDEGRNQEKTWDAGDPWLAVIERFEDAVAAAGLKKPLPGKLADESLTQTPARLGWQDEWRALELDAAARRSAAKGRSSTLDYQEATEEASFKGTMTLLGCSLIWLTLLALIAARWIPWLLWLVLPVFAGFLLLQALRWVVRDQPSAKDADHDR